MWFDGDRGDQVLLQFSEKLRLRMASNPQPNVDQSCTQAIVITQSLGGISCGCVCVQGPI
jgi:hypothetical protein